MRHLGLKERYLNLCQELTSDAGGNGSGVHLGQEHAQHRCMGLQLGKELERRTDLPKLDTRGGERDENRVCGETWPWARDLAAAFSALRAIPGPAG
jgi:hypothetical protein